MEKQKEKTYTLFALVCGNEILVGKTTSQRISAVYHRHCRGEVIATRHWAKLGLKAKFHLLSQRQMESYEAYRLIVAYVHFFQAAGFQILNCSQTIERASALHTETQQLVTELQKEPADQLLARTLIVKVSDLDTKYESADDIHKKETFDRKLTIRLTATEKNRFERFSRSMNMNQRQALLYLISSKQRADPDIPSFEEVTCVRMILGEFRRTEERLRKENQILKQRLKVEKNETTDITSQRFHKLRTSISAYFRLMRSSNKIPLTLERGYYKDFDCAREYRYPSCSGPYIFIPTVILAGKGRYPAIFLLGVADDGTLLKMRYYPRKDFSGVSPCNEEFGLRGSTWLMGCEEAPDGAMDLIYAFPLDVCRSYQSVQTDDPTARQVLSKILGRDTLEED